MLHSILHSVESSRGVLLAVAAPNEVQAVLRDLLPLRTNPPEALPHWALIPLGPRADLVLTGIGKVNAAGAVARVLDLRRHAGVLSVGIGGALPDLNSANAAFAAPLGQAIAATASIYADEGLETPEKFVDCESLGFPLGPFKGNTAPVDPTWLSTLTAAGLRSAAVATVSTCSGTNALAHQVARRTGAVVEAMEGAAVGHVAARLGARFAEIRVVSNTTGNRAEQRWEIRAAFERLAGVIGSL